jgi:aconitate hydratase
MLIPEVIGFKLTGKLKEGATATDLVLTVTQMLRKKGVVGKFVEFYGPGLDNRSLADRATIANMAPEYGATCGFFPIDAETIATCAFTGRAEARRAGRSLCQGAGHVARPRRPTRCSPTRWSSTWHRRAVAGRPEAPAGPRALTHGRLPGLRCLGQRGRMPPSDKIAKHRVGGAEDFDIGHGDVVIAAITSCTNTSNPGVLIAAGLVAARPREGPDAQAVGEDLAGAGLAGRDRLSRQGRACTPTSTRSASTSSAMAAPPASATPARCRSRSPRRSRRRPRGRAVLSGNRNFEGRVNPTCGELPRLAAAGRRLRAGRLDEHRPDQGADRHRQGRQADVYLKDIWPTNARRSPTCAAS